jgi:hypothetical protein
MLPLAELESLLRIFPSDQQNFLPAINQSSGIIFVHFDEPSHNVFDISCHNTGTIFADKRHQWANVDVSPPSSYPR